MPRGGVALLPRRRRLRYPRSRANKTRPSGLRLINGNAMTWRCCLIRVENLSGSHSSCLFLVCFFFCFLKEGPDGWQIYNKYSRVLWQAVLCPIIVLQLPPKDLASRRFDFAWRVLGRSLCASLKKGNRMEYGMVYGIWVGGLAHFVPSQQRNNKYTIAIEIIQ